MVEFDCAECGITLQPVATPVHSPFAEDERTGPYPSHLLRCPRCGVAWEQRASGRLAKSW